jgi:TonB family protein
MPISPAVAPPPAAEAPATTAAPLIDIVWITKPTGADIARVYPDAAAHHGGQGRAHLQCTATAEGRLADCTVFEAPAGQGFGAAALALAPLFQMRPNGQDGLPVAGRPIRIPIRFALEPPDPNLKSLNISRACYGLVSSQSEQDPGAMNAWRATIYWTLQVTVGMADSISKPSDLEAALSTARQALASGALKPPKGWDLDHCMAAPLKK